MVDVDDGEMSNIKMCIVFDKHSSFAFHSHGVKIATPQRFVNEGLCAILWERIFRVFRYFLALGC